MKIASRLPLIHLALALNHKATKMAPPDVGGAIGCLAMIVVILLCAFGLGGYWIGLSHETPVVIDCQECNGTGQVEYDGLTPGLPKGVYVCPMCGGSKKLTLEHVK